MLTECLQSLGIGAYCVRFVIVQFPLFFVTVIHAVLLVAVVAVILAILVNLLHSLPGAT